MRAGAIFLLFCAFAFAAPAPQEIIVNNATKECSSFSRGDECVSCAIPEGWESLGYGVEECPQGYTETSASRDCTASRSSRCCSEGHSGAAGDCDDVVVNDVAKLCAFRNESACATGEGWAGPATESGFCPQNYTWAKDACGSYVKACGSAALLAAFTGMMCVRSRLS